MAFEGYEIHMGRTEAGRSPHGVHHPDRGSAFGLSAGACGLRPASFDKAGRPAALVNALLEAKGLEPGAASVDWQAYAQQQYDKLAAGLRASLDMKRIYRILNGEE